MFLTLKRKGRRAQSPVEDPLFGKLYEGYDDQAYIELRRKIDQKIEVTGPYYLILIALTALAEILSPNRGLNLELLNDSGVPLSCILSWSFSFIYSAGGDLAIFPAWRSMKMMEKFFKEHPIKTLPPTIRRWWAREMAIKSGRRPALITGLSLFFLCCWNYPIWNRSCDDI